MVNVQAAVEAQLFGANLLGMVSREEKEGKIVTQFLVTPSESEENQAYKVEDIVKEINDTIYKIEHDGGDVPDDYDGPVKKEAINNALDIVGLGDAELTFMQTFVYYKGENPGAGGEKDTHLEYALGIHIKGKKNPSSADFKFLSIKEAYINVWDTDRQNVLERMKIWTLDQIGEKQNVNPV